MGLWPPFTCTRVLLVQPVAGLSLGTTVGPRGIYEQLNPNSEKKITYLAYVYFSVCPSYDRKDSWNESRIHNFRHVIQATSLGWNSDQDGKYMGVVCQPNMEAFIRNMLIFFTFPHTFHKYSLCLKLTCHPQYIFTCMM